VRIAITTPTGNIGRKLTHHLLDRGSHELVLLARDHEMAGHRGLQQNESSIVRVSREARKKNALEAPLWPLRTMT